MLSPGALARMRNLLPPGIFPPELSDFNSSSHLAYHTYLTNSLLSPPTHPLLPHTNPTSPFPLPPLPAHLHFPTFPPFSLYGHGVPDLSPDLYHDWSSRLSIGAGVNRGMSSQLATTSLSRTASPQRSQAHEHRTATETSTLSPLSTASAGSTRGTSHRRPHSERPHSEHRSTTAAAASQQPVSTQNHVITQTERTMVDRNTQTTTPRTDAETQTTCDCKTICPLHCPNISNSGNGLDLLSTIAMYRRPDSTLPLAAVSKSTPCSPRRSTGYLKRSAAYLSDGEGPNSDSPDITQSYIVPSPNVFEQSQHEAPEPPLLMRQLPAGQDSNSSPHELLQYTVGGKEQIGKTKREPSSTGTRKSSSKKRTNSRSTQERRKVRTPLTSTPAKGPGREREAQEPEESDDDSDVDALSSLFRHTVLDTFTNAQAERRTGCKRLLFSASFQDSEPDDTLTKLNVSQLDTNDNSMLLSPLKSFLSDDGTTIQATGVLPASKRRKSSSSVRKGGNKKKNKQSQDKDWWNIRRSERIFLSDSVPEVRAHDSSGSQPRAASKEDEKESREEEREKSQEAKTWSKQQSEPATGRDKMKFLPTWPLFIADRDSPASVSSDELPLKDIQVQQMDKSHFLPNPALAESELIADTPVLYCENGLFFEGVLEETQPPDLYGVRLTNQRRRQSLLLAREQLIKSVVLDIGSRPASLLSVGKRVCSYWSQQFSCLYPGFIVQDSPDPRFPTGLGFVNVEFDDGDSGTIPASHVRLIPQDFPLQTYEVADHGGSRRSQSDELLADVRYERKPSSRDTACQPLKLKLESTDSGYRSTPATSSSVVSPLLSPPSMDDRRPSQLSPGSVFSRTSCSSTVSKMEPKEHRSSAQSLDSCDYAPEDSDSEAESEIFVAVQPGNQHAQPGNQSHNVGEGGSRTLPSTPAKKRRSEAESQGTNKTKKPSETDCQGTSKTKKPKTPTRKTPSTQTSKTPKTSSKIPKGKRGRPPVQTILINPPPHLIWRWSGPPTKEEIVKSVKKIHYGAIEREGEYLKLDDTAVFLTNDSPEAPYVGRLTDLYEIVAGEGESEPEVKTGQGPPKDMRVVCTWFYHPHETRKHRLKNPKGGLFASSHRDENDLQTVSRKCELLSFTQYKMRSNEIQAGQAAPDALENTYYLAGHYFVEKGKSFLYELDVKRFEKPVKAYNTTSKHKPENPR